MTTDTPSGTIEIVISAPGIAILDLSQFSITLDEVTGYDVTVEVASSSYTAGVSEPYFIINGQQTYYMTQVETFNLHNVTSIQFAINGNPFPGLGYGLRFEIGDNMIYVNQEDDGSYSFSDIITITENTTIEVWNNRGGSN